MEILQKTTDGLYEVQKVGNVRDGWAIVDTRDNHVERFVTGKGAALAWTWGYETHRYESQKVR